MSSVTYNISFLPEQWDFEGKHFSLKPVDDYQAIREYLDSCCVYDSLQLPVQVLTESRFNSVSIGDAQLPVTSGVMRRAYSIYDIERLPEDVTIIPNSFHCCMMHQLPSSHVLTINQPEETDPKTGIAAYLISIMGVVIGTRLQFSDWWFDSPIPFRKLHGLSIYKQCIPEFLDRAVDSYRSLASSSSKTALINALIVQQKAKCTSFEWEQFYLNFLTLEGLLFASGKNEKKDGLDNKYKDGQLMKQINYLTSVYGIPFSPSGVIDKSGKQSPSQQELMWRMKNLRNDLIHQVTFDDLLHGSASKTGYVKYTPTLLRNLNSRIIVALILGNNEGLP